MINGILVVLAVVAGVVILSILFGIGIYNRLVVLRNRFRNAFSQIDVQLKRRYDLIPNLIETAKAYMSHERSTLEAVVNARNAASSAAKVASSNPGDASAMSALAAAETTLGGSLGRLFAVAEAYPDLKANQNMLALQGELSATENQIASARESFNEAVTSYNSYRESFPNILFANIFNFSEAKLFELESDKIREAPRVAF